MAYYSTRLPQYFLIICLVVGMLSCSEGSMNTDFGPDASQSSYGSITGNIYDAETLEPISQALVEVTSLDSKAYSSSGGNFSIDSVPSGVYQFSVTKSGYVISSVPDITVQSESVSNVEVALSQTSGTVSGYLKNTQDAAIANATIVIIDNATSETKSTTSTDSNGAFSLSEITNGEYKLSVTAAEESYTDYEKSLVVDSNNFNLNLILSGQATSQALYLGSAKCSTCHSDTTHNFENTNHHSVLKGASQMNVEAKSYFQNSTTLTTPISARSEDSIEILLTEIAKNNFWITIGTASYQINSIYGGKLHKESYLTKIDNITFVLPVAWSLDDNEIIVDEDELTHWLSESGVATNPDQSSSYKQRCIGCHTSGFEVKVEGGIVETVSTLDGSKGYQESTISCERCHGPGSEHVEVAESDDTNGSLHIVQPRYLSLERNIQVCAQCHSEGTASQFTQAEINYPIDENGKLYRPGENLDDIFSQTDNNWNAPTVSKFFHQQYSDYKQSKHYQNTTYNPRCSDCHDSHADSNDNPSLLKQPVNDNSLCLSCHQNLDFPTEYSVQLHTQHPYDPEESGASRCVSCHMTKTGKLVKSGDTGGHSFKVVTPADSLSMLKSLAAAGETDIEESDIIPSPCVQCHNLIQAQAIEEGESTNVLAGNPTSEDYLEKLSAAFTYKFEDAKDNKEYVSFSHTVISGWMDKDSDDHHGKYYIENTETCTSSCHGADLKGGALSDGSQVPSCFDCHYPYPHEKRIELDNPTEPNWVFYHKNYYEEQTCKSCHGDDFKGGISEVSCYTCHETPGEDFTVFNEEGCLEQACHGTPPNNGAHDKHYQTVYTDDATDPQYGDTENYSTTDNYSFGCGTCHPTSSTKHRNGTVDVELYNEHADSDTIKGKMSSEAEYDANSGTCNNVYCHSYTEYVGEGQGPVTVPFPLQIDELKNDIDDIASQALSYNTANYAPLSSYFIWNNFKASGSENKKTYYWSLPLFNTLDSLCESGSTDIYCQGGVDENGFDVFDYDTSRFGYPIAYPEYQINQVRRYQTTPNWHGDESLTCNGCHSYPPRSYATKDGLQKSQAAIDKHSFVITNSITGSTKEVGHMANMKPFSKAPIRCQVCHVDTVEKKYLSSWESGEGWSLENNLVKLDDLEINDKSVHANGSIDVVFDQSSAASTYKFNNKNYYYSLQTYPDNGVLPIIPDFSNSSDLSSPKGFTTYYYGVKGKDAPGATWSENTKTCSNVSCHLEQESVKWTRPYRPDNPVECYQCHQYNSNPFQGQNASMCWPHADNNGCESSTFNVFKNMTEFIDLFEGATFSP
jgi:predicted CxxxxCH...CXXCH cytochrome family protein